MLDLKKQCSELEMDNMRLRSKTTRQHEKLRQKDRALEQATVVGGTDMSSQQIAILRERNRANVIARQVQELRQLLKQRENDVTQ